MPSFPSGGSRPQTRPGNVGPGGGERPSLPDAGNRPSRPGGDNRPSLPGGGNRPGGTPSFPGGGRPQPGDLGDFLGIDKPLRPETQPGFRPDNRPVNRPDSRPGSRPENRPAGNRPGWIDGSGSHNNIINNKPGWINIDNSTNINIHNRWTNAINNQGNRVTTLPAERRRYWDNWGGGVRHHWDYGRYHNCFNDRWWSNHYHGVAGWHYCSHYNRYHWSYWWRRPAWGSFGTWFVWWNANSSSWQQPVYYDYGSGGNVYYEGDTVYLAGEPISSADDFAMSAGELATVAPPASEQEADSAEWMPLGTFALSTGENDIDPSRVVQLAVDRQGIISGTLYNTQSDQTQTIQGQVDKQTQRVAFRMGDSDTLVAETGLYNLTQDEVPLLVHFGTEQTQTYLLVRLDEPAEGDEQ
ncbi:proline-rich domain-containing protein [Rubinisphaera margarita]|uniref:proline-rich domain-containing protein n=1 Tax=Rubinisphaera margarita TaxID=2909586 RepID=UPI001EE98328|nr:proline-rich domain-containing protein [Rubinisphaera margarita]MCG6156379.1 hypothetical protein [Rubinisphaera margarita]